MMLYYVSFVMYNVDQNNKDSSEIIKLFDGKTKYFEETKCSISMVKNTFKVTFIKPIDRYRFNELIDKISYHTKNNTIKILIQYAIIFNSNDNESLRSFGFRNISNGKNKKISNEVLIEMLN